MRHDPNAPLPDGMVAVDVEITEHTARTVTVAVPVGLVREDVAALAVAVHAASEDRDREFPHTVTETVRIDGNLVDPDPFGGLLDLTLRAPDRLADAA